ncbi:MAG: proprotein convertase P-domain-containing protein, partial [Myxococcales bacterium]|nr:proprotein convertase P-domain-containing protein [Myxococcales bacterium]
ETTGSAVDVTVRIAHTFVGDLKVILTHGEVTVVLHDEELGDDDDLYIERTLEFDAGTDFAGEWSLHVSDGMALDEGRLLSWGVTIVP